MNIETYKAISIALQQARADLLAVYEELKSEGLATGNHDLLGDMICCPGLDYCNLANARSIPIAQRIQDPQVLHLVKQIIKVGGKVGVPQGGPFSPLAANVAPVVVMSTIISAVPTAGAPSVAPALSTIR